MRCPYCKSDDDRVIDSRASADGFAIRRRRLCRECGRRYTTYERAEGTTLRVVKKSGERVEFDRQKILSGVLRACEKRPIASAQLEELVDRIERQCAEAFDKEVPSKVIGELIMERLRELDQVAYVRFASVYRAFKDANQFLEELKPMLEKPAIAAGLGGGLGPPIDSTVPDGQPATGEPGARERLRRGIDEEKRGVPGLQA